MRKLATILILALSFMTITPSAEAGLFGPKGECGFKVVSYRVQGAPGASFQYAGKAFTIPAHGTIEIVARKSEQSIRFGGESISLEQRQPNDFGIVDVHLASKRETMRPASSR